MGPGQPTVAALRTSPLAQIDGAAAATCPCYLAAWIADDPADEDGSVDVDAPLGTPGHGVLLIRGAAFAGGAAVAEVEALVAQPCRISGALCAGFACSHGAPWARAFLDRSEPRAYHRHR